MKFKKDVDVVYSSELHYDLFDGGYIKPENMLENIDDADKVNAAIDLVRQFLSEAQEAGNLEAM